MRILAGLAVSVLCISSSLTCDPNLIVAAVHLKAMPVILHEEDHERWLGGALADASELATPYPLQLMSMA